MKQPRFRVGDIVTYNDDAGHLILKRAHPLKKRVKFGCKGIIIAFHNDCFHVGEFYTVSWFGNGKSVNEVVELNLCKGMTDREFCKRCEHRVECRRTFSAL